MRLKENFKESLLTLNKQDALNMTESEIRGRVESIISKTYMWVGIVLFLVFGIGYYVSALITSDIMSISQYNILFWLSIIIGFGLVVAMSRKWQKMSYTILALLLILFGIFEGLGLGGVFLMYNMGTIINAFLTTSIMFIILAFAGYVLHVDVTKIGSVLVVALIALFIGFIINMFWQNSQFEIIWSVFGLIIFAGLMVYDMNLLKQMALSGDNRVALIMALSLFLNFINIFLLILRLSGNDR